jgi:3-deoxy-D-manno-octulosonate 8-phosphate phosphatase (KDO 8-P phosphatase)
MLLVRNVLVDNKVPSIKLLVLDFDGVLTDNRVLVSGGGKESVFCNRGDGFGIVHILKPLEIETIVISVETNKVVLQRCKKLGIECFHGVGVKDKLSILKQACEARNISLENVAFVGNDLSDIECIKNVGFGVADAEEEVKKFANLVTKKNGGYGAVREFCNLISKKN